MNIIVVLLTLAACLSLNIQAILFIAVMFWLSKRTYAVARSSIAFYLFFFLAYPQTFIGETDIDRNMPLLFSGLFLLHAMWTSKRSPIRLERWQRITLSAFCLMCLVVYLPIVTATLLSVDVWNGAAEQFVSNNRGSYMLTFVTPFLAAPLVALGVMKGITDRSDFGRLYGFLKLVLWIVILPSFARYALNQDFIPQEYTPVRYDGNRLSAFMHPDSLGYGRRLLFPIALVTAYAISSRKYRKDFLLFFALMITVAMTLGRTTSGSALVVLTVVVLHNLSVKKALIVTVVATILAAVLIQSGVAGQVLARNVLNTGGVNLSGRGVIWGAAAAVITASPFVGLRPGGWVAMLTPGDATFFGVRLQMQSAHSLYLQVALDWGIPVLLMLVGIMIHSAVLMHLTARRLKDQTSQEGMFHIRNWAIATEAAIFGLLVHGITETVPYYLVFFVVGLAWSLHFIARHPASFAGKIETSRWRSPNMATIG